MKGFKNTTRMVSGHTHVPASEFHTFGKSNPGHRLAQGGPVPHTDKVSGLHEHGGVKDFHKYGPDHALVKRDVPSTDELDARGGTSPVSAGYKKGGGAHHFHVHKHYHSGGKVRSESKSYRKMEREAEKHATGGTINKLARGGRNPAIAREAREEGESYAHEAREHRMKKGGMHINPAHKGKFTKKMTGSKRGHLTGSDVQRGLHSKSAETRKEANFARMSRRHFKPLAKGGHVIDSTHEIAPDYATGGTINRKATGGTINKKSAGGALYAKGGHEVGDMKKVAHQVVGEHIKHAAPQGHSGLGALIRRGR